MKKILKYVWQDVLRSKVTIVYALFLLSFSVGLFFLEDNSAKALLSLMNIVLLVVPLFSSIFTSIYFYNRAEFMELLMAQPISRLTIANSVFGGVTGAMMMAFFLGVGLPLLLFSFSVSAILLLGVGLLLTVSFSGFAAFLSLRIRDKAKGMGWVIMLWLFFGILFDALLLLLLFQFGDYPIEFPAMILSAANPIDIGRIILLLHLDNAALMSFTSASFKSYLGSTAGQVISWVMLLIWCIWPYWLMRLQFMRKDW